jgi:hypothetical protein
MEKLVLLARIEGWRAPACQLGSWLGNGRRVSWRGLWTSALAAD